MKLRIVKVEDMGSTDKEVQVCYHVERKYFFWWEHLLHPWLPTLEAAEKYVSEYLKLKGGDRRTVIKEYDQK